MAHYRCVNLTTTIENKRLTAVHDYVKQNLVKCPELYY